MKKMLASIVVLTVMIVGLSGCTQQQKPPVPQGLDVEARAVQVVERMNNKTVDAVFSSWFAPALRNATSASELEGFWDQVQTQYGAFVNITHVRNTTVQNFTNVFVTCLFANSSTLDVQLTFDKNGQVAGLHFVPTDVSDEYRPPSYANTSAFTETNVTVGAGTPWALPGTLSMPKGSGPFPAVVLVQGSGPNDRDETVLANKPFKDLAWGLASQGIAVLRYDKRTNVYGSVIVLNLSNFTVWEETVQDAQRAVALLQSMNGINASRIFVLGHSLGGMLDPRIAKNGTGIHGLIMLAAPVRHLEDLALNQTIYLANLDGNVTAAEQQVIDQMTSAVVKIHAGNISANETLIGGGKAYWTDLEGYHQVQTAENLTLPMFILQGKRDYQVNYTDDFLRWEAALGGRQNVAFKAYENLTHLFMPGSEPPSNADYTVPENVAVEVVEDIAQWVRSH